MSAITNVLIQQQQYLQFVDTDKRRNNLIYSVQENMNLSINGTDAGTDTDKVSLIMTNIYNVGKYD